jgi:glycosyltransferase involved in cell wall biosynthesis
MDGFFDELIICDTGSSDNTMGYLNEAGVPYIEKKMEDDFSEIRNHMIDLSTTEYILHLDADETPLNEALLSTMIAMRRGCDVQRVHLHSIQKSGEDAPTEQPRLFKNNGIFRYEGRVHETLEKSLAEFEQVVPRPPVAGEEDIHFSNKGYLRDNSRIDVKLNYYAKLLRLEIEDNPDNHKALCELAAHERNISNYDECERLLLKCIAIDSTYLPAYRDLAMLHAKRAFDVIEATSGQEFFQQDVVEQLQRLHQMFTPLANQPGVGTEEHRRGAQPESYKTATKND